MDAGLVHFRASTGGDLELRNDLELRLRLSVRTRRQGQRGRPLEDNIHEHARPIEMEVMAAAVERPHLATRYCGPNRVALLVERRDSVVRPEERQGRNGDMGR